MPFNGGYPMSGLEMLGVALTIAMVALGFWRYYAQGPDSRPPP